MILLPPETVSHYECNNCGHRVEVKYFHDTYSHLSKHSIVWCFRECVNMKQVQFPITILPCYKAVLHPPTISVPAGRRMIQL